MRAHGNKHDHCTPCGLIESFKKLNSRYKTSVPGAYPVAAHPSFLSMKWLRSIFPPNRMGSQLITTGGERGTVGGKCFGQEHNTMTWPGLEPRPLDSESTVWTNLATTSFRKIL